MDDDVIMFLLRNPLPIYECFIKNIICQLLAYFFYQTGFCTLQCLGGCEISKTGKCFGKVSFFVQPVLEFHLYSYGKPVLAGSLGVLHTRYGYIILCNSSG